MKRFIFVLLIGMFISSRVFAVTTISEESFSLVLTKEGESKVYFSSSFSSDVSLSSISLISETNTIGEDQNAPTATFYVGYDIYNNLLSIDSKAFKIAMTFSSTMDISNDADWMLKNIELDNGLVFDYTVSLSNSDSLENPFKSGSFQAATRNEKATLAQRQVILYEKEATETLPPVGIHGKHKVQITINPPKNDNGETAFVTGQYVGYVILSVIGE